MACNEIETKCVNPNQDVGNFDVGERMEEKTILYSTDHLFDREDDHISTPVNDIGTQEESKHEKIELNNSNNMPEYSLKQDDHILTSEKGIGDPKRLKHEISENGSAMGVKPNDEENELDTTLVAILDREEGLKAPQPISEIKLSQIPIKKEKKKYFRKHYSTEQLQEALQKCREGLSIRECSKQFGIPKSTLWDKLSYRTPAAVMRPGRSIKVSQEVENRLATWILHMNQNGFKVPDRHAINAAKLFQNISEGLDPDINYGSNPGKSWYKSFVERFSIAAHNQNSDFRKVEFSLEKIKEWYYGALDTTLPILVETVEIIPPAPDVPPQPTPEQSSTEQVKSVLQYIEETVGPSKINFYKEWKESGDISKKDPLFVAWFTLATELDRRFYSNKTKRKRKSEQPRLNDNYINQTNSTLLKNDNQICSNNNDTKSDTEIACPSNDMIDLNSTAVYLPNVIPIPTSTEQNYEEERLFNINNTDEENLPPPVDKPVNLIKPHPRKTMRLNFNSMK